MPAPRRKAAWGTRDPVLEDLRLARDAGGLARTGIDRREGSLRLRFQTGSPEPGQRQQVREWLAGNVIRGCQPSNGGLARLVFHFLRPTTTSQPAALPAAA